MLKFLPLAVAISVLPLSNKISNSKTAGNNNRQEIFSFFNFKNNNAFNLFEPEKKPTEAWSQNWYATAQENIRQSEYHFTWEEKLNAYCTPNRKNNLRFFYNEKGFSVEPRTTKIPIGDIDPMARPDEIKYKNIPNWKIKFNLDKKQVYNGKWQIVNNTAEYITDNITVQYINNDEGMRQNFIVHKPLSKSSTLKLNLNIKTKLKNKLNGNRLQFFLKKTNVLNYEDLKVWDANNKPLKASFLKNSKGNYCIQVDAKDAAYPITIDPISTGTAGTPDWLGDDADQTGAIFGSSVASAGDVNGDGYSDVIIGAPRFDEGASLDEGRAFVYHGSAAGLSSTPNNTPDDVDQANAFFGVSVATAGDVNGDGYSDVIIGAYLYDDGVFSNEGRAFVYHGSAAGLLATPASTPDDCNQTGAGFGASVAGAGDVNGDGYSDVIIGANLFDDGPNTDEGRAFVYYGSATGINAIPNNIPDDANQIFAEFGNCVASAGDVNSDGYSDVVIGAFMWDEIPSFTNDGKCYVYHGSALGLSASPVNILDATNENNANLGISVACAGDVNGDGYSDIIAGAPGLDDGANFDEGKAFVYFGSAGGSSTTPNITLDDADQLGAAFGCNVASAGDVNGDGYSDVIIGANLYDDTNTNEGVCYIYYGTTTGLTAGPVSILDDANQDDAGFGSSVASAGDVNGDGYSDVIVGAYFYTDGVNAQEGRAFVYHGGAAGLSATPNSTPDDADQAGAEFGISVASAGDVNGDGYSDVIIGANLFDDGANTDEGKAFVYHGSATGLSTTPNSTPDDADQADARFGRSVASAGDVNGDGYSDVIIGATQFDDGFNNEGKAFVYHGGAAGLSATPNSQPDDADQLNAQLGICVASAGDVNGDGYSDVIIGANLYDEGASIDEGRAFVYHGSATGLSTSPNSTPDDANQADARFGRSVASAGDVNGDGYGDVIIGATQYDDGFADEGRAFVYYGSAAGLSATPNNTPDDADQASVQFGLCVASAGDVNGDGYSDVIIGANLYDDGANVDEGRAFVYHGSATGLSTTPGSILEDADQAFAFFGNFVASAGDVNGDGYSDVIIGAQQYDDGANADEGRAFVYHGSAVGLSATPNSTPDDANQAGANFGQCVAGAGDVNGDGYSDVIIGARLYDDGFSDEGRAFVYQGNDSVTNKRNNLRLYNTNLTTPINSSNFLLGNFGAGLYAKSFLGRARGKLVWETRLNFDPYSGTPITNSTFFTNQQSSYTNLGLGGTEIKNLVNKIWFGSRYTKIRARVKYDPVTAITGQVYGPWRNVSSIIDANNLGILPIELISFNAAWIQKGKTARLDFKTDKESGVCCFDIEKSNDGFNFYSIGTMPAKNIAGIQSYSFIDAKAAAKKQFYRIKIKGIAGQMDYSNIQQLSNDKATEILVFPNPTTDVLQLQLNKAYDNMHVRVFNASGQLVKQLIIPASNQVITMPVQHLAAGKYWLHLQSGVEKQVLQFLKE